MKRVRLHPPTGRQQRGEFLGNHGLAEVKALSFGAVMGLQEGELFPRFDALGHDPLFEAHAHRDAGEAIVSAVIASPASPPMSCTNDWSILSVSIGKRRR